ncbi:dihydrofolate reductase family protein [[Kitasatospora] papulosa]|uniref:dihydrofolate reductase family protein n=1 Tax=[Kitasatospora] papulosa TaxID=1464011 RepID=UPI0004BE35BA|nr:dihydrofolate reductase family protein [[Kitasatospora] papulosa]
MLSLLPSLDCAPSDSAALDRWLAAVYAPPEGRWVRACMIASLDGAATVDGRSGGLSSAADRAVLATLRGLADVVLVGAETARREEYRAADPHPVLAADRVATGRRAAAVIAVVSQRLDLDPALFHGEPGSVLVITSESSPAPERRRLEREGVVVLTAGADRVEVARALELLADRGLTSVLTEGGPRLLAQLHAAGALEELCLTVAPNFVGGNAPRILQGAVQSGQLRLEGLLEEDGYLFTRYRVHSGGSDLTMPD